MARMMAECRRWPSETNCSLTIIGEEDEVLVWQPSTPLQCTATRTRRSCASNSVGSSSQPTRTQTSRVQPSRCLADQCGIARRGVVRHGAPGQPPQMQPPAFSPAARLCLPSAHGSTTATDLSRSARRPALPAPVSKRNAHRMLPGRPNTLAGARVGCRCDAAGLSGQKRRVGSSRRFLLGRSRCPAGASAAGAGVRSGAARSVHVAALLVGWRAADVYARAPRRRLATRPRHRPSAAALSARPRLHAYARA